MKKVLKTIGILLGVAILIGGGIFAALHFGLVSVDKIIDNPIKVMKDEYGKIYTQDLWEWNPKENTGKIIYTPETSNDISHKEVLEIDENKFIECHIPDGYEVRNDNLKTIYARDGSFIVRICTGVTEKTLPQMAGMKSYQESDGVYLTLAKEKGAYTIAKMLDKFNGIIIKVYADSEAYSVLLDYCKDDISIFTDIDCNSLISMESLPECDKAWLPIVELDTGSLSLNANYFSDGYLYIQNKVTSRNECRTYCIKRISMQSAEDIKSFINSNGIKYAYYESGEYSSAVLEISSNQFVVMNGKGIEAKENILHILHNYE